MIYLFADLESIATGLASGIMFKQTLRAAFSLFFLLASLEIRAQDYNWTTNADHDSVTVTRYIGQGGVVEIPSDINGLTVTSIGTNAFYTDQSLGLTTEWDVIELVPT